MSLTKEELDRASKLALKGLKLPSGERLQAIRNAFKSQENFKPLAAPEVQEEIKQEVRKRGRPRKRVS